MPNSRKLGDDLLVFGPDWAMNNEESTLLLGEAPNRWMSSSEDRKRHVLWREDLMDLFDLNRCDYFQSMCRANLLDYWPGRSGKGSGFPPQEAREAALRITPHLEPFKHVILFGKRLAKAFGEPKRGYLEWFEKDGRLFLVCPHPSKVNRWWNSPENKEEGELVLRPFAQKVKAASLETLKGRNTGKVRRYRPC